MGYPQISLEDANVWFAASNVAAIVGAVLVGRRRRIRGR
jgi:hypothetical protein